MKKINKLLVALLFFFIIVMPVNALDTSDKVHDNADLLTDYEEQQLQKLAEEYIEKYDMDLVIVTTPYNEGKGTELYAMDFYDDNGFGIGETYDGILFLIDRTYGYNDTYMVTTGHAILVYDDARIDSILDDIYYVRNDGYYAMFETFISSSSSYAELGVASSNENMYIDEDGEYRQKRLFPWFWAIVTSLGLPTIIVGIFIAKNKMVKKETRAAAYLNQNSVNFSRKEDRFVRTDMDRKYVPRNTSSGGGGSRGGSSISRSSSGRSHGGGGRRM